MQILRRPKAGRDGFTLVDVCVAIAILAIALGTLVGCVLWAMRLEEVNEETAAASQSVRAMLEGMQEMPIEDVYAAYNADPADDPDPGRDYMGELEVQDPLLVIGKKAGPVVSITFPDDVEDQLAANRLQLTMRLEWQGMSGARSVEVGTLLRNP